MLRTLVATVTLALVLGGCATTRTGVARQEEAREQAGKKKVAKVKAPKKAVRRKSATKVAANTNKGPSTNVPKAYSKRKNACEDLRPMIGRIAKKYELEPELVMGVIKVESSFNPKTRSRVGARGLMQVMPRTGEHMKCGSDLADPATNVECGCKVLRRYLDLYDGNQVYALSAYNAGPGNANPSAKGRYLPFNFKYVEKVFRWRNVFVRYGCY